jgi:dTDP-4-amino-4,6-dideoxygalactose transaminase
LNRYLSSRIESVTSLDFIPHSRPTLGEEEARAAAAVVACGQLAEGPETAAFERELGIQVGAPHAVVVSSGTAALHAVLAGMGIGAGHEVIIPSFVCAALLHAVARTHATPVPAEIDPGTLNLDPQDVARRLSRRTAAVILPHMFGRPADMEGLLGLGVPVIEDCAQSLGAVHGGRPVGSFGRAAVFSFYATKVIATGEGGMVATASAELAARVKDLKTYDKREDHAPRFNYKLTDIQAAVGRVQLRRLAAFIRRRRAIAARYRAAFQDSAARLPPADTGHIYFRYVIDIGADCTGFIRRVAQSGIGCERPVYIPLHRLLKLDGFPRTEQAWRQCVSIPIYPSLTDAEVERITDVVSGLLEMKAP